MKAVLDTNVLVSAVISTGVPHEVVVAGFEGGFQERDVRQSVAPLARRR
jgi:predicted nucleic acid-binding protein